MRGKLYLNHANHATSITLSDRFSVLASLGPPGRPIQRRLRPQSPASISSEGNNGNDHVFVDAMARKLDRQTEIAAFRQSLGLPQPMYSRQNQFLGGMRRAQSFEDLGQANFGRRSWNSVGDLRSYRPGYFPTIVGVRRSNWLPYRGPRRGRGTANMGLRRNPQSQPQRQQRQQNPIPTREELDQQLDEYMAKSRFKLDKELEEYMRMADMETESQ